MVNIQGHAGFISSPVGRKSQDLVAILKGPRTSSSPSYRRGGVQGARGPKALAEARQRHIALHGSFYNFWGAHFTSHIRTYIYYVYERSWHFVPFYTGFCFCLETSNVPWNVCGACFFPKLLLSCTRYDILDRTTIHVEDGRAIL